MRYYPPHQHDVLRADEAYPRSNRRRPIHSRALRRSVRRTFDLCGHRCDGFAFAADATAVEKRARSSGSMSQYGFGNDDDEHCEDDIEARDVRLSSGFEYDHLAMDVDDEEDENDVVEEMDDAERTTLWRS